MSGHKTIAHDICIVGGGPAGSSVARSLALLGHDVCVVEGAAFPRSHIGESLPPNTLTLLDGLGMRQKIEDANFLRPKGAIILWADDDIWEKDQEGLPGFQVDRGVFDQILLDGAREAGAKILQPLIAARPRRGSGGGWRVRVKKDGKDEGFTIKSRFLIDASGRRYLSGGRKKRCGAITLALYAYWRDVPMEGPESRVEAGQDEWYWCAPLPDGTVAAAVFTDPKRLADNVPEDIYRELLSNSRLLAPCLEGSLIGQVTACDATSRYIDPPVGEDFIRVGDTFIGLDPLSSQGVPMALASALHATAVVNTILSHPENAEQAMKFYKDRQTEKVIKHENTAAELYRERVAVCDTKFWRERAKRFKVRDLSSAGERATTPLSHDCLVGLSKETVIEPVFAIHDDIVTAFPGLHHPSLNRPVAFLGGCPIERLTSVLAPSASARTIAQSWSRFIPYEKAVSIMEWMWERRILVLQSE